MISVTDVIVPKDKSRMREVHLSNGNKYIVSQTDPYGLWNIHMEKGQIPKTLKQQFTEFEYALREIRSHLSASTDDKKQITSVKE